MWVDVQRHAPADLPPGKIRYPLYRRLGGPQAGMDGCGKSRLPPGFDPRTVHPVASRYNDWAIAADFGFVYLWLNLCVCFVAVLTKEHWGWEWL